MNVRELYQEIKKIKDETTKTRILITGDTTFENKIKIKDFLFNIKQKYNKDVEIISTGQKTGADKYIKKYSLEFNLVYKEFNLPFTNVNLYSVMPEEFYGKQFHFSQIIVWSRLLIYYSDKIVLFLSRNNNDDKYISLIFKEIKKQKKDVIIVSDK